MALCWGRGRCTAVQGSRGRVSSSSTQWGSLNPTEPVRNCLSHTVLLRLRAPTHSVPSSAGMPRSSCSSRTDCRPQGSGITHVSGEASRYSAARSLNKQEGPPRAPGAASPGNEALRAAMREAGPPPRLPREVPGLPWGKHNVTRGPAGPEFLIHSLGGARYSLLAQAYLSVGLSLARSSILLRIFPDVVCLLPLLMGPLLHCESCLHTDLIIPFS